VIRALVADDSRAAAFMVKRALERWGVDAVIAADGVEAWASLDRDRSISLGIFDWMMPGMEGPDLCRRIRADPAHDHMYVLLLTQRGTRQDLVTGLDAGADDYLVKPFDPEELRARVHVGLRVLALQRTLQERAAQLHAATVSVTELRRLLPICSYCRNIRNDQDYWEQIEGYLGRHTDLEFTHGICPSCYEGAVAEIEGRR
jgi:phosphoserine phosphatase RsbU/P